MTTTTVDPAELVRNIVEQLGKLDDATTAETLDSMVHPAGRAKPGASPAEATPVETPALKSTDKIILRPNGQQYHVRSIGDHSDVMVLRTARENNIFVFLYGPPGTGKTALIEAAFASDGNKVYTVQGSADTTMADFIGGFIQLADGTYEWVDGPLLRAMTEGCPLYIDEISLIDPRELAGLYSVMDGRGELRITQNPERGVVTVTDGFYVVGAGNPHAPGARMSEALTSRFTLQFEVTTDYSLAKKLGVDEKVVRAARNLSTKFENGEIGWAPQLRELLAVRDNTKVFGAEFALRALVSNAPEMYRPQVMEVLSRECGTRITELRLR